MAKIQGLSAWYGKPECQERRFWSPVCESIVTVWRNQLRNEIMDSTYSTVVDSSEYRALQTMSLLRSLAPLVSHMSHVPFPVEVGELFYVEKTPIVVGR